MTEPLRVGDPERNHAVAQLQQQAAVGRLTPAELEERSAKARQARYDVDLDALFRDIPGGLPPLPTQQWDLFPPVASGVSDGEPGRARQDLAGPVVSGPVEGTTGARPPARGVGWVWGSASSICVALGVLGMALDVPKAWVMFVIAFVVIPLLGSFRRR